MADSLTAARINLDVAERINRESRDDPSSPLAGKFVGIVDGQVMAVADELDEVVERLHQNGIEPVRALCFEVGLDYDTVEDIWDVS